MQFRYQNSGAIFLLCMSLFLFFRCTTQTKNFIPGTYVTEWTTEFTVGRDTLRIERSLNAGSDTYEITRRTFMNFQNKPNYKITHWTGIYNKNNKTIFINNNGRILSFDPGNGEMKMGSTRYKKL